MKSKAKPRNVDDQAAEAKRILDRVARESETVGSSTMVRSAIQPGQHGADPQRESGSTPQDDPIEILGRKIGRSLGWIAVVFLLIYLVKTYVLK